MYTIKQTDWIESAMHYVSQLWENDAETVAMGTLNLSKSTVLRVTSLYLDLRGLWDGYCYLNPLKSIHSATGTVQGSLTLNYSDNNPLATGHTTVCLKLVKTSMCLWHRGYSYRFRITRKCPRYWQ